MIRIGKSSKGKCMALKAKSNNTDKSSDDEDSKMKSYITHYFKKFMKNQDKTASSLAHLNSITRTKERRMLGMIVSTLFPQDQNALGVKALVT